MPNTLSCWNKVITIIIIITTGEKFLELELNKVYLQQMLLNGHTVGIVSKFWVIYTFKLLLVWRDLQNKPYGIESNKQHKLYKKFWF